MEISARLYRCPRCGQLVTLCSYCDRGNIYCFSGCSEAARKQSMHEAGKRYQDTAQGRLKHAHRQAAYRARQDRSDSATPPSSEKVTHHGSEGGTSSDLMEIDEQRGEEHGSDSIYHCHCCGRVVDPYLRSGYLRYSSPSLSGSSLFQRQA